MTPPPPVTVAPYGSWTSPVTAASLSAGTVGLAEPHIDGADFYWLESRASEGGRVVVVRCTPDGLTHDVTPPPFNARSRVHEYGGGAYAVAGGVLVFCDFADRRVYRTDVGSDPGEAPAAAGSAPVPITPAGELRYGDLRFDESGTTLLAVCEDHSGAGEAVNRLVRLNLAGPNEDGGAVLVEGPDFVSSPALSPDGRRLAWVQWDHPNMPWDATELCVADVLVEGTLGPAVVVAGGPGESVVQPGWAPDGRLVFASDRTGWWNLYATEPMQDTEPVALWPADREFAGPDWMLGMASYGISDSGTLLCSWLEDGYARLGTLDLADGTRTPVESDVTAVDSVCVGAADALLVVGYADRPAALIRLDPTAPAEAVVLRRSAETDLDPGLVSRWEPLTWQGHDGDDVHGFYLPPRNPAHAAPDGELPPLLVVSHGGPTGMSRPIYDPRHLYWTTRGFAVLDVNYGGSAGYGRAYRERLRGLWGVVDVDDCVTGATQLVSLGLADQARLAIRGASAGGYTTLAALTFRDVFTAGASWFGVADVEALMRDTHKFESRYGDGLIGPYPESRDLYRERSPIHHVDKIGCPVILFQGSDDMVVPRNQADEMAAAVRAKKLPVALVVFEGEGHGFRRAENVTRAYEAEAHFYSRVFGFELADDVEPVEIGNLPAPPDARRPGRPPNRAQ